MAIQPQIAMGFRPPQIESPLNMMSQFAQLQQIQEANALRQAQARKLQLEEERGNALVQALRGGRPTLERLVAADPGRGFEVYKAFQEQQKAQAQQDEERRKKFVSAIYGSFEDPSLRSYGQSVLFLQQQKLTDPELDRFLSDLMFVDEPTRKQQLGMLLNAIPGGGDYIRKIASDKAALDKKLAETAKVRAEERNVGRSQPTIQNIDLNNEIVTQLVDPNTGRVTMLGTRPKAPTPEQKRLAEQERRVVAGIVTDETGKVTQYNKFGEVIQATQFPSPVVAGAAPGVPTATPGTSVIAPAPVAGAAPAGAAATPIQIRGKPSAQFEKTQEGRAKLAQDLDTALVELRGILKPGGLIDQSTGSGVGSLVDTGARIIGHATRGDVAIGQLQPIADLVLKLVPRFEGPQSDKDTRSYKEAAGQLADPTVPREIRRAAAQTIIRLMENRKSQFGYEGAATEPASRGAAGGQPTAPAAPAAFQTGAEQVIQSGPNRGKTAVFDGVGWKLKE